MSERSERDQPVRGMGGGGLGGRLGRGGPVVKPKNFKVTLKRLWFYLGKERKWLSVIFLSILIDSGLILLGPYLIGASIDAMTSLNGGVDFKLLQI
jgi:ATP-binding cassette, subfamily B, multidrug efflux pump